MARPAKPYRFKVVASNDLPRQEFKLVSGLMLLPYWPFMVPVFHFEGRTRPLLAVVPQSNLLEHKP